MNKRARLIDETLDRLDSMLLDGKFDEASEFITNLVKSQPQRAVLLAAKYLSYSFRDVLGDAYINLVAAAAPDKSGDFRD